MQLSEVFVLSLPCRDIPMPLVSSGVEHGNLRELALARMKDLGTQVKYLLAGLRESCLMTFLKVAERKVIGARFTAELKPSVKVFQNNVNDQKAS